MLELPRKLSWRRKLLLASYVLLGPPLAAAPVMFVATRIFEGGQKFGIVVTFWTAMFFAAAYLWKAAE